jgi:hypothetical protein
MSSNSYREPSPCEPEGSATPDEGESWFQPLLHGAVLLTLLAAVLGRFHDTHTIDAQSSVALVVAVIVALVLVSETRSVMRGAGAEQRGRDGA